MKPLVILAAGIALGGSAVATYRAHRNPMSPQWDERVGETRFRRSDLPFGGGVAMALAFGSLVTGHRKAAAVLASAGLGATAGSLGVALIEPLPDVEASVDDFAADSAAAVPWQTPTAEANAAASGASVTPASDSVRPPSATPDLSGDERAEQELERAAEVVEHQASYGSPTFDDTAESNDEPLEPEVTGSAPQEGQTPLPDSWFRDQDT